MIRTIQDCYLLDIRTTPHGIESLWHERCVALAMIWNTNATKPGMAKGMTFMDRPGYAGTVWVEADGTWNRDSVHSQMDPWDGWVPINDIVAILNDTRK